MGGSIFVSKPGSVQVSVEAQKDVFLFYVAKVARVHGEKKDIQALRRGSAFFRKYS